MEVQIKVVAIGGSPRLKGCTNYMIDQALDELNARGVETEKIVLNEYKISPCQAHDDCASLDQCLQHDDIPWILEKYSQADGIIIASPVYSGSISAQMKIFKDRTFFLFTHNIKVEPKRAGLIAIAGRSGADETIEELRKFVRAPETKIFAVKGYSGTPDRNPKELVEVVEQARAMGRQMAEVLAAGSS